MSDTDQKDELRIHVDQDTCKGGFAGATCRRQEVDQNMMLTQTLHCDYDQLCRLDVLGLADSAEGDRNVIYQEFKEQLTRSEEDWYETGLPWKANHPFLPSNEQGSLRLDAFHKKLAISNLAESYCIAAE